ncbi:hypothetical protein K6119_00200 [Paracrocinitomix mangrovi]|uniref:hypothetical protein n=1 Tax=Paracrocinitomix mangrovi TaxID=2862509 RepID=UPI001C8E5040|nr:hypothetical protein [Paracrocinitomix mangrovi]UKN01936.1 hypothetical protein K6119_00200 [Paracrocinitomix mangrovi]
MKKIGLLLIMLISVGYANAQEIDSLLQGKWQLFNIIDNMTGKEIKPTHKSKTSKDFKYTINFQDTIVTYNLEINKCDNEFKVTKDRNIEFKYFSNCTELCCDGEFSELLTYPDCTKYYIKENKVLIMVSEDRIFYFNKMK